MVAMMKDRNLLSVLKKIHFNMQNTELSYQLNFQGYWRHINRAGLPAVSGVYAVYRCTYNQTTDKVTLHEIIYIGQAVDVNDRHKKHDKLSLFQSELKEGEELCYTCAEVDGRSLDLIENALVFAQKPRLNDKLVNSYDHQSAHIKLDGCTACMKYTDFSITL